MSEKQRLTGPVRDKPPCGACTEKFDTCHAHCPKDERGEYGYQAYLKLLKQVNEERRKRHMKYGLYYHDYKEGE